MRAALGAALLALGAALAAAPAGAQERPARPHRSGLWFEFFGGPAAVRIACSDCGGVTRAAGSGGGMRAGGTISDKVFLAFEAFGYDNEGFGFGPDDPQVIAETATVSASVLWFPWRSGVFIKGGVGLATGTFTVPPDSGQPIIAEGLGVGLTFGLGYDLVLSRTFALTANAGAFINAIGDIALPTRRVDDVIATMYSVSVGLTIR